MTEGDGGRPPASLSRRTRLVVLRIDDGFWQAAVALLMHLIPAYLVVTGPLVLVVGLFLWDWLLPAPTGASGQ